MSKRRNHYWEMAKMAFILGAAGAAGNYIVVTGIGLMQKTNSALNKERVARVEDEEVAADAAVTEEAEPTENL